MKTVLSIAVILLFQQSLLFGQFYFNNHYLREGGFYDFSGSIIHHDHIYTISHYNDPFVAGRVIAKAKMTSDKISIIDLPINQVFILSNELENGKNTIHKFIKI